LDRLADLVPPPRRRQKKRHSGRAGRRFGIRCFGLENGEHAIHEPLVSLEIVAELPLAGL